MRLVAIIFLLFFTGSVSAQERNKQSVGFGLSVTRMDFFFQTNYQVQLNRMELSAGAGIGILRSIFQGRIFPEISLRSSYYLIDKPSIQLGPTLSLNYSGVRLNKSIPRFNFWQEYYLGYSFTVGKRLKFVHILELGPMIETYFNDFEQKQNTVGTLGYSLQIGCRYAL